MIASAAHGTTRHIVSCGIFGGTLLLVYICSTLYHSLVRTRARHVFQVLDHSAIYLLIAGTYTPFTVVSVRGKLGWALLAIVWTLAAAGVIFKSLALGRFPTGSVAIYMLMGWLAVIAMRPLIRAMGWHAVGWLVAGGLFYTAGIIFFAFDGVRYFHALWHVLVLAGSVCHYFAVLLHVVPNAG